MNWDPTNTPRSEYSPLSRESGGFAGPGSVISIMRNDKQYSLTVPISQQKPQFVISRRMLSDLTPLYSCFNGQQTTFITYFY